MPSFDGDIIEVSSHGTRLVGDQSSNVSHHSSGESLQSDYSTEEDSELLLEEHIRRRQIEDDMTIPPERVSSLIQQKRIVEHSFFHLIWGMFLVVLILVARKLPRLSAGRKDFITLQDELGYWDVTNLLKSSNMEQGLLPRLKNHSDALPGFLEFAFLSKESLDRREPWRQQVHAFYRSLAQQMNKYLINKEKIEAVLDSVNNKKKISAQERDYATKTATSLLANLKSSNVITTLLEPYIASLSGYSIYAQRNANDSVRRLLQVEKDHINATIDVLEGKIAVLKGDRDAKGNLAESVAVEQKLLRKKQRAVIETYGALEKSDHWMLLAFVKQLPKQEALSQFQETID